MGKMSNFVIELAENMAKEKGITLEEALSAVTDENFLVYNVYDRVSKNIIERHISKEEADIYAELDDFEVLPVRVDGRTLYKDLDLSTLTL